MAITHLLLLLDELTDLASPLVQPSSEQEWQITNLLLLADEMTVLPLPVLPSSDQEWQLHNSTVINHIGR